MLRQLFAVGLLFVALQATADVGPTESPLDSYIALEIEKYELEQELFTMSVIEEEPIAIQDIEVYELVEEDDFDTAEYLPENFNATKGMYDIDWSTVELYELEEELDLGFDTRDYLPEGFDPYKGMICLKENLVSSRLD